MKLLGLTSCFLLLVLVNNKSFAQKSIYKIILKTADLPGDVDTNEIKKLNEPLKGLLALYSAMGGTNCNGDSCELTTALGLGEQGSDAHQALIRKYFPEDKVAKAVLAQACYLRPSGASSFSEYEYLTLSTFKDTVKVYYRQYFYDHGKTSSIKGPDIYYFHNNKYQMLKRKL